MLISIKPTVGKSALMCAGFIDETANEFARQAYCRLRPASRYTRIYLGYENRKVPAMNYRARRRPQSACEAY